MLALATFLLPITGNAQVFKMSFKGTCNGTNADGSVFKQDVNNKTLIRDWAGRVPGVTNFNKLELVYHQDADGQGNDAIEVVNKKTGAFVVSVFPLMFPQTVSQSTAKKETEQRFFYVFNVFDPGSSRGTTIVSEQTSFKNGNLKNFNLDGEMFWYQSPGPDNTNLFKICNGKFNASGKPLAFK
jgi:hypothetical protein